MTYKTTRFRFESDEKIRERLLVVISDYHIRFQAMQGVGTRIVNPFRSLDTVVKKYVNPLFLLLNDIRLQIENQQITYVESLEKIALFSHQTRFRDDVIVAVKELEEIEKTQPYFLYALQCMVDAHGTQERGEILRKFHRDLIYLNKKYQKKFGLQEQRDVVPWRIRFVPSEEQGVEGSYYRPNAVQLNGFRNVIINLSHNLNSNPHLFRFHHFRLRREIEKDIVRIAELLFDFGFTVERITASRQRSVDGEYIETLLNDHILSKLEKTASRIKTIKEISTHISYLSRLDLRNIILIPDFCRINDHGKALAFARKIEKADKRCRTFRRIADLYEQYQENAHAVVAKQFLNFVFSKAHHAYRASQAVSFGGDYSKTFIFPLYFNALEVHKKAENEIVGYSSKGKEEMLAILQLLLNSLMNPQQFRDKSIVVLGDIESGAMGKVSIGIYKGNIVALKKPLSEPGSKEFSRLVKFLKHEGFIHGEIVQQESSIHKNIVECYGVIQTKDSIMVALGYYPADNLETLIQRNRRLSSEPHLEAWQGITLEVVRRIFMQLIDALVYLKSKKVIHRDLKPANILFLTDPNGVLNTVKIVDFGVAISLDSQYTTDLFENKTVGTLNYMAPEQLVGNETYSSDIYSLGAIMYTVLTGKTPLILEGAQTFKEKLKLVYRGGRTAVLVANNNLIDRSELVALCDIIDEMIALRPEDRPTIDHLNTKLKNFWSGIEDAGTLSLPIIYETHWETASQDSLVRTTTDLLDVRGMDDQPHRSP